MDIKKEIVKSAIAYWGDGRVFDEGFVVSTTEKIYFIEYLRSVELVSFIINNTGGKYFDIMNAEDGQLVTNVKIGTDANMAEFVDLIVSVEKTLDKLKSVCYTSNIINK